MNLTSFEYTRQANVSNYTFLVIDDSDVITNTLSTQGYANNMY